MAYSCTSNSFRSNSLRFGSNSCSLLFQWNHVAVRRITIRPVYGKPQPTRHGRCLSLIALWIVDDMLVHERGVHIRMAHEFHAPDEIPPLLGQQCGRIGVAKAVPCRPMLFRKPRCLTGTIQDAHPPIVAIPTGAVFRWKQPTLSLQVILTAIIFFLEHVTEFRRDGPRPNTFFILGLANEGIRIISGAFNGGANKYLIGFKIHSAFKRLLGIINFQGKLLTNP